MPPGLSALRFLAAPFRDWDLAKDGHEYGVIHRADSQFILTHRRLDNRMLVSLLLSVFLRTAQHPRVGIHRDHFALRPIRRAAGRIIDQDRSPCRARSCPAVNRYVR